MKETKYKNCILCDPFIKILEKANLQGHNSDQWLLGAGGMKGELIPKRHGGTFEVLELLFIMIVVVII